MENCVFCTYMWRGKYNTVIIQVEYISNKLSTDKWFDPFWEKKIGMFKKKYFSPWTKLIESILKSQQPYFMIFKVNCKHFQLCSSLYWQVTIWQNIDYFLNGPAYKIAKYSIFHWFLNNILLIKCLSYEILLPGDYLAPYRPFLGLELLYNRFFIITLQVLWENELRIFRK